MSEVILKKIRLSVIWFDSWLILVLAKFIHAIKNLAIYSQFSIENENFQD